MTDVKEKSSEEIEYVPEEAESQPPKPKEPEPAAEDKKEHADPARSLKDRIRKKDAEIKHLKKEMDDLKDQFLRKLADTENLRKRLEREKNDFLQFALSELLLDLLSILDNFERALQSAGQDADGKTFRDGVELIYRMLQSLLVKKGVQAIVFPDRTFDPNLQHAMTMEESDGIEEAQVTEELQKGYTLHGRLLRPAMVKVAIPKKG